MIGGTVIEVCNVPGRADVLFVNVAERSSPRGPIQTCGVLVENNVTSTRIQIGDCLWWQSGTCYWTPYDDTPKGIKVGGLHYDIKIPKRSCSGVTFESVCRG